MNALCLLIIGMFAVFAVCVASVILVFLCAGATTDIEASQQQTNSSQTKTGKLSTVEEDPDEGNETSEKPVKSSTSHQKSKLPKTSTFTHYELSPIEECADSMEKLTERTLKTQRTSKSSQKGIKSSQKTLKTQRTIRSPRNLSEKSNESGDLILTNPIDSEQHMDSIEILVDESGDVIYDSQKKSDRKEKSDATGYSGETIDNPLSPGSGSFVSPPDIHPVKEKGKEKEKKRKEEKNKEKRKR